MYQVIIVLYIYFCDITFFFKPEDIEPQILTGTVLFIPISYNLNTCFLKC